LLRDPEVSKREKLDSKLDDYWKDGGDDAMKDGAGK
jgi:hypothetical protein